MIELSDKETDQVSSGLFLVLAIVGILALFNTGYKRGEDTDKPVNKVS